MELLAPAKINLFLELIERRSDGFHELETIMTSVGLCDRIFIRRRADEQIGLACLTGDGPDGSADRYSMPLDSTNLVWQAVDQLRQCTGQPVGVDIVIQKNIPSQAGMGGGSSDAAAVLSGVNRLWQLGQSRQQLVEIGNRLGSDVGFFFGPPTARCTGRGEVVQTVTARRDLWVVLAMPPQGLSTARIFRDSKVPQQPRKSAGLVQALQNGNLKQIGANLSNRLQTAAEKASPWINRLRNGFDSVCCPGHQMTGSGAGYFGIFPGRGAAVRASRFLAARISGSRFFCQRTIGQNAMLIKYRVE